MGLAKMVVTLLPGDEGYVIALAQVNKPTRLLSPTGNCSRNKNLNVLQNGAETELCRLGYEESASLLESLDMEELPVMLTDLLADLDPDPGIFHSGCVVAEIRDLRPGGRPARARHVLLRPSAQSLICDSQAMARAPGHARWTSEDRANLESQVVLASEGPLCLDPSPVVSFLAAKAHHARHKFATVPLRRATIKRYSQAGQNRKRKLESLAAPSELRLHDFIRYLARSCCEFHVFNICYQVSAREPLHPCTRPNPRKTEGFSTGESARPPGGCPGFDASGRIRRIATPLLCHRQPQPCCSRPPSACACSGYFILLKVDGLCQYFLAGGCSEVCSSYWQASRDF